MFNDAAENTFKKVYIACGRTDLRYGAMGLASLVKLRYQLNPYDKGTLFLFCGCRTDRIKGLLWEGLSEAFCYPHIFRMADGFS